MCDDYSDDQVCSGTLPGSPSESCQGSPANPETGERIWFNQAALWHYTNLGDKGETLRWLVGEDNLPTNAYYGDGLPIEAESLQAERKLFWDEATLFEWREGDVLMLDNRLVAHGRRAFKGERRILVAMT